MKFRLLVADDEKNIREGLAIGLEMAGYDVQVAADGNEAFKRFLKGDIDLVITDLRMPGLSGDELLKKILGEIPDFPVIILTGHGTVESAVEAMRIGAWNFLSKPVNLDHLTELVKQALANRELVLRHRHLLDEIDSRRKFKTITGSSAAMRKVFDTVSRAAVTKASILITGESGVGKELVSNAIHDLSPRKDGPPPIRR